MKLFGSIKELVSAVFRKNSFEVTLRPNQSTTYTAARDIQFPPGDADHVVVSATSTQTLTNKSIDADTNTITNIENADIKAAAAIARTKLASGSVSHVLVNDGSGVMTSEAQLDRTRGGTGVSSTATFPTSGVVVTEAATQTLTNKSLTSPDIDGGTIDNTVIGGTTRAAASVTTLDANSTISGTSVQADGTAGAGYLEVAEQSSAPATPASGFGRIYPKTDNKWYTKDDSGTETQLGAGSSGELNLVESPSDSTGWTTTGGNGPTGATTTTAGDLPLGGTVDTALKLTSATAAGAEASHYISYPLSPGEALKNRKLKVEFWMRPGSNFLSGEWTVSVYSGATRMALSTDSAGATTLPNLTGKFTTTFDADSSSSYTLRFSRPTNAGTNAAVLNLAAIVVGPGTQPQGAVVGEPQNVTFTGTWNTNTTYTAKETRVGSWAKYDVEILFSGAPNNTTGKLTMPAGRTIDTSALATSFGSSSILPHSTLTANNASGSANMGLTGGVAVESATVLRLISQVSSGTAGDGALVTSSATAGSNIPWGEAIANGDTVRVGFWVPIAEWAGSGTLNVAQNDVEYAATSGTWDADSSTTVYGPGGSLMGGALTAARSKTITWQTPIQPGDRIEVWASKDQVQWYPIVGSRISASDIIVLNSMNSAGSFLNGSGVSWYAGSTAYQTVVQFSLYANMANDDSPTVNWPSSNAYWVATKAAGGQAVGFGEVGQSSSGLVKSAGQLLGTNTNDVAASGYVGETITVSLARASANGLVTATAENVTGTTLDLTAGDWDISGIMGFTMSGATATEFAASLSSTSNTLPGTSTIGVPSGGEVRVNIPANFIAVSNDIGVTFPTYRVSLSGASSFYFVARAVFSAGSVSAYGLIQARRVR